VDKERAWEPSSGDDLRKLVEAAERGFPILTDSADIGQLAQFHKALGDETRLRVVGLLQLRDTCLCEMVDALKVPASTMNHHLRILERGGVIMARREGKFTIYSLHKGNLMTTLSQWPLANTLGSLPGHHSGDVPE